MVTRLLIFYFTGTGNALVTANWIKETAESSGITAEIRRITPSLTVNISEIGSDTLIGFCYPTHGFNAPPVVIDFILRVPRNKNNVFLLNTRAGMKLWKFYTPGITGLAQLLPAFVLSLKGFKIVGLQPMDLPSNWISIHPGLRQKVVDSIFIRCEKISKKFAGKIISGKNTYKGLLSLPVDLAVSPISVGYYFYGRFALSKTFIADYHCNGCGICEKECPVHAIKMKNRRPFWTRKCESCMHCMNRCPKQAVQTPHVFVLLIWWLVFSVFPVLLVHEAGKLFPFVSEKNHLFYNAVSLITGLPFIFFSYRILHFLMKYKLISRLVNVTSLTRFKFWRRYSVSKKYLGTHEKN